MATTLGYIEVPFTQRITSLTAATRHDFAAETLYIPQTTNRTIRSAWLELTFQQNDTAATNQTSVLMGIKLGATAFDDATSSATFTNAGEINAWNTYRRDVTSYFVSNFGSGATQTCQIGVQIGGASVINVTAKICVAFEYDVTDDTRVKLVKIPIESRLGDCTTSYVELGTDSVPNLDTFLPEASKTYRHIWFEFDGNDNQAGTVDYQQGLRLDVGGSDDLDGTHEAFSNASRYYRRIWRPTVTTNATHKVYSRTTNATSGKFAHHSLVLCVLYEFNESSSTSIMNSLWMPAHFSAVAKPDASGTLDRVNFNFMVQEPNVSLEQSAVQLYGSDNAGSTVTLACGGQTARAYVHAAATVDQGMQVILHRFDSGGAAGSGFTLVRGLNTLTTDAYTGSTHFRSPSMLIYLNYTSDKASGGSHTHNKTIPTILYSVSSANAALANAATIYIIPESDYWLTNFGTQFAIMSSAVFPADDGCLGLAAQIQSGEGNGAGWADVIPVGIIGLDTELCEVWRYADGTKFFKQWPNDPRGGMDIETSRPWVTTFSGSGRATALQWLTYHTLTATLTGVVSNYVDADGAGLIVSLFEKVGSIYFFLGEVTTTTGGNFTYTWYVDPTTYGATDGTFAVCNEGNARAGASLLGT